MGVGPGDAEPFGDGDVLGLGDGVGVEDVLGSGEVLGVAVGLEVGVGFGASGDDEEFVGIGGGTAWVGAGVPSARTAATTSVIATAITPTTSARRTQ